MKNLKLSVLIFIMCFMAAGYVLAESTVHIPALKIRAAVIIDSGVSDQSFATGEDFFEYMHDNRFLLAGNTYVDMNFSFYNPRGNQDSITYWRLSTDQISSKILEQYDVLLMPLRNMNSYSGKMKEIIGDWIQKGGVLWIDNYSYTGKLGFLPIYDFVSAETLSGGVTQNENSALRNYPFDNYHITETNESRCLRLFNFDGMYHYANPLEYVDNKYNIATGIISLGAGKLIYSNGITGDRNNVYKCANLLFDAFAPNSNTSYARRPALLGNSLNATEEYYGDKPLVADGHTYYINDKKLFVDGVDLTAHGTGVKPGSNSLSCPAKMGDGDIVVYDSEGCLYLCSGIKFNDDGTLSSSDVTWFKLYDADKSCYNSVKFSPLVYNYWVYFTDDNGNLHLVYTKGLDGGEAKYTWVTRAGLTDNAMLKSSPCIYSRTDMYGSYVTEVAWVIVNDAGADTLTYMLCSVPVAVVGEECYRQPQNVEPMGQTLANYVGFPNLTGNNTFRFYGSQLTDPDKVFTNIIAFGNDNSYTLAPHTKDNKSKWDYKINYNASGTGRLGCIQFNTEKR
ncbi:MAG: hypothetical protein KBT47_02025, partial [Armatimonadetes bacterium]|nr:hypothetical protein [Candidatus Hippobium faecium]